MTFPRRVEPELLDALPSADPRAVRSRSDLRRVNRLMGTMGLLARALDPIVQAQQSPRIVELGAGDGSLMLRLARHRAGRWPRMRLGLLDMQPVVSTRTLTAFRATGWDAQIVGADVFDWLARTDDGAPPIVVANLFVHHFDGERLASLLRGIAARASAFVCCEPRRSRIALGASRMLGLAGCNAVTRHDAVVSVRAGFSGDDLSSLWPRAEGWQVEEGVARLFCHRFVALRSPVR